MNSKHREMIDTLLAISEAAKRLAIKLAKEEKKHGAYDEDHQRIICPYCCTAGVHGTDH
ncbi:MAG: hypothetical protein NC177_15250 [Ruminococcus flavefaciens]|nr:hypothetical protein [Ruminococcus flavefaciens]